MRRGLTRGIASIGLGGAVAIAILGPAASVARPPTLRDELRARLSTGPVEHRGELLYAHASLSRFFAGRDHMPAWAARSSSLEDLLAAIDGASAQGLEPEHYHRAALRRAIQAGDPLGIELLATDAYLTLAAHVLGGRLDPVTIEPAWTALRRERDLVAHLSDALREGRIAASVTELEPDAPEYAVLKDALHLYRQAAREGGWDPIPPGPALRLRDAGPRVATLRQRLRATGLLAPRVPASDVFDGQVETAVIAFQRRVGIEADGVVGRVTLQQLNRSPQDRIEQIRANLERWRWLPEDLGVRHLRVNIADFSLEARQDGGVERRHDVIVGRTYRKTPVFSSQITSVVLNPWWETPDNLARQDELKLFQKDPRAVTRLGFEVLDSAGHPVAPDRILWTDYSAESFPFRLRQRPGPQNALGPVKLVFPNAHSVYLHGTPSRELFARARRAFSSGCVRVSDVAGLARWLLRDDPRWSGAQIDAALASGTETRIRLRTKVPVHILYFTAVAAPDGSLRVISDVYGRDVGLIAALGAGPPPPRAALSRRQ